jgi:hypothetical protein
MEKEIVKGLRAGYVRAPASPLVTAPIVVCERDRKKLRMIVKKN